MKPYQDNQLTVTRQVPCHPNDNSTIDILLSLNGIPVVTMELKNPASGQTWKNAVYQYKNDRDPHAPLFRFKQGALVHFVVDPDADSILRAKEWEAKIASRKYAVIVYEAHSKKQSLLFCQSKFTILF